MSAVVPVLDADRHADDLRPDRDDDAVRVTSTASALHRNLHLEVGQRRYGLGAAIQHMLGRHERLQLCPPDVCGRHLR